jgi:cysteine-S-conjugate beta-lyase
MTLDFQRVPERRQTDSQKWQKYAGRDILPMWVADMDFTSPPPVIEALHRRVDHGVFGYARPVASTVEAVQRAFAQRYGWDVDPAWIVWLPGMVCGLNLAALAFAEAGESVLTLTPVYPPFLSPARHYGRTVTRVPWELQSDRWVINWERLEQAVTPQTRLFFLCNPHNPLGRVWRREELARLAEFCLRHQLVLVSDEIHCDLILDESLPHVPTATLGQGIAARTVTLMAPSKTYNIPGLGVTLAIISDAAMRQRFHRAGLGLVPEVTSLGYVACEAAYAHGEPWRQELLRVLRDNRDRIRTALTDVPEVRLEGQLEATYLAWLNVAALNLADPVAHFEAHGLGLSDGAYFGAAPGHYVRLNFGCPAATLEEALRRLRTAVLAARSA